MRRAIREDTGTCARCGHERGAHDPAGVCHVERCLIPGGELSGYQTERGFYGPNVVPIDVVLRVPVWKGTDRCREYEPTMRDLGTIEIEGER